MTSNEPYITKTGMTFDASRIHTADRVLFRPFYVEKTEKLRHALARRRVPDDERLLAMRLPDGTVLTMPQRPMSYHHVAQGEIRGYAWLVAF